MPRNSSGTYTLPEPPFVAGTVISSAAVNDDLSDIATALTGSLPRDGSAGMLGQLKLLDGSAASPSLTFSADTDTGFFRASTNEIGVAIGGGVGALFTPNGMYGQVPVGAVLDFASDTLPVTVWVLCYGQAISRSQGSLFGVIGTTYGSGDGVTTFNVPDLRGVAVFGKNNMGGTPSSKLTTLGYGSDPNTIGTFGGFQANSLTSTAFLPTFTPSGLVNISDPGHTHTTTNINNGTILGAAGGIGAFAAGGNQLIATTSGFTINSAGTGVTATFSGNSIGSASQFTNVPPGVVMNKIIYTGF